MACPSLPTGPIREIIEKTIQTGNEHAFVQCADGSVTEVVEGGRKSLDIDPAIDACGSNRPVTIVHTHPNGVRELSDADRKVAARDDVEAVCAAVDGPDPNVKCESIESCVYDTGGRA